MFDYKRIITEDILDIRAAIMEANGNIRIVGGAVRDMLMGKEPKDIDFATDLTPTEVMTVMLRNIPKAKVIEIETGIEHGTVTINYRGNNYELTTLRKDIETDGRHAKVQFTKDWREDAERRDLTINAMSMNFEGRIYDYFNGRKDLEDGVVRFVGDAGSRIREDYVRILRYFRFCARTHVVPRKDDPALEAIRQNAEGLTRVSGERIWTEMREILASNEVDEILTVMHGSYVFPAIGLPINLNIHDIRQVAERTRNPITRLTAGLTGRDNPFVIEDYLETLKDKWKVNSGDSKLARFLLDQSLDFTPGYRSIMDFQRLVLINKVKLEWVIEVAAFQNAEFLPRLKMWTPRNLPINGIDLIAFGMKPGKEIGEVINALKDLWITSIFRLSRDELLRVAEKIVVESHYTG